jgi:hypothetical protein
MKIKWGKPPTIFNATLESQTSRVALLVAQKDDVWIAAAVETPLGNSTLNGVFEDHAHAVIGEEYRTAMAAKRAANRFARAWFAKHAAAPRCPCKTISTRRRKR